MLPVDRISATRNATSGLLRQRALWLVGCLTCLRRERHEYGGSGHEPARSLRETSLEDQTRTRRLTRRLLIDEAVLEVQRPIGPSGSRPASTGCWVGSGGPRCHRHAHGAAHHAQPHPRRPPDRRVCHLPDDRRARQRTARRERRQPAASRSRGASASQASACAQLDRRVDARCRPRLIRKHTHRDERGQQPATWELTEPGADPVGEVRTRAAVRRRRAGMRPSQRMARTPRRTGPTPVGRGQPLLQPSGTTLVQSGPDPGAAAEHPPRGSGVAQNAPPPRDGLHRLSRTRVTAVKTSTPRHSSSPCC